MKKLVVLILILILCSCSIFSYRYNPREDCLDCDSSLPMQLLLKCINDKYEMMDKWSFGLDAKRVENRNFLRNNDITYYKNSNYDFTEKQVNLKETDIPLPRLNSCGYAYKCNGKSISGRYNGIISYNDEFKPYKHRGIVDYYDGRYASILYWPSGSFTIGMTLDDPSSASWDNVVIPTFNYFTRSLSVPKKDLLMAKKSSSLIFYALRAEVVRLKDKDLLRLELVQACPFDVKKHNYKLSNNSVYIKTSPDGKMKEYFPKKLLNTKFEPCGYYHFWLFDNLEKTEENLALSLDRRVNPTKAYIRLGEHTYELDLTDAPF